MEERSFRASGFPKEISAMLKRVDQERLGSLAGKEKLVKILPNKDVLRRQLRKGSLEDSARMLNAMNKELDLELTKHRKVQLSELAAVVKALNEEMRIVEAVELDVSRESLWDIVKDGSSLRSLLESLKMKLETILSQKPELTDKKEHTIKMLKIGSGFEACQVEVAKGGEAWEGVAEACSSVEEKNNAYLLRTKSCGGSFHAAEHLTLAAEEFYKEKAGKIRPLIEMTTLSEGTHATHLSDSGACATIVTSGEEEEEPNKLVKGEVATVSQVDADPSQSPFPDFSIRNFVSNARNKDIESSWPFSRRSLKLCMKHGVKNLLPPFQSLDSVQSNFTKQCWAETVLPAEISSMGEKPLWLKNHPVSGSFYYGFEQKLALCCTDSNSSPSSIQDFASKITGYSQSEIESVSTSNMPLSKVSDKQGPDVPPIRQKKKGASLFIPNKKRQVVVKLGANMDHGTAEDITSTCTVPPEAVAQKTCPVCGIFSSSSNTTLNAHIDQCLLAEPTSDCMKGSKTVKATLKPRKIRLMSEICATAPCCTVQDLDIRNGRVSIADTDLASHANSLSQDKIEKESSRYVKDTSEDNTVYIDSSGTKVRILSKTSDALLITKCAKELNVKKSLKKGKRSKLFVSTEEHLTKNLKLSNAYIAKVSVRGKANFTAGTDHQEAESTPFKLQEQNKVTDSGHCLERTVLSENNRCKGKRGQRKCKVRVTSDLFADSHESCFANSNDRRDIKKSHAVKTGIDSVPNNIDPCTTSWKMVVDEKGQFSRRRKCMISSPLDGGPVHSKGSDLDTAANQFIRENCRIPEASEATPVQSSPDEEVDHGNTVEKKDLLSPPMENLSAGYHDPKEVSTPPTLGKLSRPYGQLSIVTSNCSGIEESRVHNWDEATIVSTAEIEGKFNSTEADADHHTNPNELVGSVSSAKLLTGVVVASFSRPSNPELYKLTDSYSTKSSLLQLGGGLFGTEPSIHLSQPCLGDMCETIYETEGAIDIAGHNSEDIELENSFPLVESIPIPGPPGSYLPSFRDSCFEHLQTSQDAPDIDKINSESPTSGASTISGTAVAYADLVASESPPHIVSKKVFPGLLDERSGPREENATMTSFVACDETEKLSSDIESSNGDVAQSCGCLRKEGISWNALLDVQESQLLRGRMITTTVEAVFGSHVYSNLNMEVNNLEMGTGESSHSSCVNQVYENVSYASSLTPFGSNLISDFSCTGQKSSSRPSGCDLGVVSPPPVLRLMGKDLMVLNNDEHATAMSQPSSNISAGT